MKSNQERKEHQAIKQIPPRTLKHLGTPFRHQNRGTQAGRLTK